MRQQAYFTNKKYNNAKKIVETQDQWIQPMYEAMFFIEKLIIITHHLSPPIYSHRMKLMTGYAYQNLTKQHPQQLTQCHNKLSTTLHTKKQSYSNQ